MIFGREPALWLALGATTIRLIAAFIIDLTTDQQSALNAIIAATVGLVLLRTVKDGAVAAILGFVQALVALAIGFGLNLDADAQAVIMSTASAIVAMFVRTQVTAPVPPSAI